MTRHHSAPAFDAGTLRERERETVAALQSIDEHLSRLQEAKAQRQAGLAKIRASLALTGEPQATNRDDD
jgi:hypothetical protein